MFNYIWAFDISLSNTGVAIFDLEENPQCVFSIATTSKLDHGKRLKLIADTLLGYRKLYPTNTIVLESGFSRYAASTQAIFKTVGVVNYLFSDCRQIYYAPSTIKKIVGGSGRSSKEEIKSIVEKRYPMIEFADNDQSDAVGVFLCYVLDKNMDKMNK